MPSSHIASYFHLIFSTKDRVKLINSDWESRLHAYLGGIINGMDAVPPKVGGVEDHVHILVNLKSKHRLDYILRDLKADSSAWVHREITLQFEWQKGYGAFSVSPTAMDAVSNYIENKREHHSKIDFKSKYVELLTKSGIGYDDKYLW